MILVATTFEHWGFLDLNFNDLHHSVPSMENLHYCHLHPQNLGLFYKSSRSKLCRKPLPPVFIVQSFCVYPSYDSTFAPLQSSCYIQTNTTH